MKDFYGSFYGVANYNSTIFTDILNRKGWFICRPYPNSLIKKSIEVCCKNQELLKSRGGQIRAPLCKSQTFLNLVLYPSFLRLKDLIDDDCILNQQNLLYLDKESGQRHEQSRWHRDMPYLKWLPKTLAIFNALMCINPNKNEKVHCLDIIEGSHSSLHFPNYPIPQSQIQSIYLKNGEMLIMNSFLYHRAPTEIASSFFLLNSVFTPRCFKQQVNYQEHLSTKKIIGTQKIYTYLGLNDKFMKPDYLDD